MKRFNEINGKLAFGCMRLPQDGNVPSKERICEMFDAFLNDGYNYFDTARGYMSEKSESVVRECLAKRYSRDRFILTDKLSNDYFNRRSDIRPLFEDQLKTCGVDYFDFYLFHAMGASHYIKYTECGAFDEVRALKDEGKIRHIGMSFHDRSDVLETILNDHPEIEVVQLQINYVDYEDELIQGRLCMEVCKKHNVPVFVMEPIKGGMLANVRSDVEKEFTAIDMTPAAAALRYVSFLDGVELVLSGMSNLQQVEQNIAVMQDPSPISEGEARAVANAAKLIRESDVVPCTACRYCVDGCPKSILIPDLLACLNTRRRYGDHGQWYYDINTKNNGKASACIECGKCESACPQKLPIRKLLKETATAFEKSE